MARLNRIFLDLHFFPYVSFFTSSHIPRSYFSVHASAYGHVVFFLNVWRGFFNFFNARTRTTANKRAPDKKCKRTNESNSISSTGFSNVLTNVTRKARLKRTRRQKKFHLNATRTDDITNVRKRSTSIMYPSVQRYSLVPKDPSDISTELAVASLSLRRTERYRLVI